LQHPQFPAGTDNAVGRLGAFVSDMFTPVVRVGVTGLARSGKTVFITSLVRCLVEGGAVPEFSRLRGISGFRAYLEPQPDDDVARFAYEDHLEALSGEKPVWPESTRQISQLRLTLEWDGGSTTSRIKRLDVTRRLHIDIVDYPGEWLIDLGMIDQSYGAWSREALLVARSKAMEEISGAFLAFVDRLPRGAAVDEQTAIEGTKIFTRYLVDARKVSAAGNVVGPGRFIMPGDLAGSPQLTFFPVPGLPAAKGKTEDDEHRLGCELLERRFESYKSNVVIPFFQKHFVRLDRQIVLVDLLSALNGGADALNELEQGLETVLRAFRPGHNSWLSRLLVRRIDKIVFAATKADHVHKVSRARLEAILEKAIERAGKRAESAGASIKCVALAALRSTEDVDKIDGEIRYRCVRGILEAGEVAGKTKFDGDIAGVVFPGDLPANPLDAFDSEKAKPENYRFFRFRPPEVVAKQESGLVSTWPHINLDATFAFLLGDDLP